MIEPIVETTSAKAAKVRYKKRWLSYRSNLRIDDKSIWMFIDGSSSGWHAAVTIDPFSKTISKLARYRKPESKNIGPELWSLLIGLKRVNAGHPLVVVHDYIGTGAWLVGAWKIKSPNVQRAVNSIRIVIAEREFDAIKFIHHGGHGKDYSDFSTYNNMVDALCTAQREVDTVTLWEPED